MSWEGGGAGGEGLVRAVAVSWEGGRGLDKTVAVRGGGAGLEQ